MKFVITMVLFLLFTFISVAQEIKLFEIRALDFGWMGKDSGRTDLCAHGGLYLRIGDSILSDEQDGEWTLSATALNLLRTLKPGYSDTDIIDFIVPCCGMPFASGDKTILMGCNQGIYWDIRHVGDKVHHKLGNGEEVVASFDDYKKAIYAFADAVEEFYRKSEPKDLSMDSDADAFQAMWKEWRALRTPK
jgi:hypothetical protein